MNITAEERLEWWHEARFGMFIHWGISASLAGEWKGEKSKGLSEWIMRDAKIPVDEYESLANTFNPVAFDAEEWAEVAKQAGMKYLVITAKHHDGFCMFDSPSNPYNIVNCTPFKRDPMKELAEACAKRDIKMCFYYSQDLDWHAEGGDGHWDEPGTGEGWINYGRPLEDFQTFLDRVVKPNLRELLTQYGPVGLIWFDTPITINKKQSEELRDLVHEIQPECLVSGRVGNNAGDYGSLGDNELASGRLEGAWETPATLNDSWGFKKTDENWKSLGELLELLSNCASKGVNYLLNVGPTAEGIIPQPSVDLLKHLGGWMERNGEAIYGTVAGPSVNNPSWGAISMKGETLYCMVKEWPKGELRIPGLRNEIRGVRILGAENAKVEVGRDGDFITLALPAKAPEDTVSVVAVDIVGEADMEQIPIQDGVLPVNLPTHLAVFSGEAKAKKDGCTQDWNDIGITATWTFRISTPGNYRVMVKTRGIKDATKQFGNHKFRVTIDGESTTGTAGVKDMDMGENAPLTQHPKSDLGSIALSDAGDFVLTLQATTIDPNATWGVKVMGIELTLNKSGDRELFN